MAAPALSDDLARAAMEAVAAHGSISAAARALSIPRETLASRHKVAKSRGLHLSEGARGAMERVGLTGAEMAGGWIKTKFEDGTAVSVRFKAGAENEVAIIDRIRDTFADLPAADAAIQVGMNNGYARTLLQELTAAERDSRSWRVNLTF